MERRKAKTPAVRGAGRFRDSASEEQGTSSLHSNLTTFVVEDFYTTGIVTSCPASEKDSDFIVVPRPRGRASGKYNSLICFLADRHGLR